MLRKIQQIGNLYPLFYIWKFPNPKRHGPITNEVRKNHCHSLSLKVLYIKYWQIVPISREDHQSERPLYCRSGSCCDAIRKSLESLINTYQTILTEKDTRIAHLGKAVTALLTSVFHIDLIMMSLLPPLTLVLLPQRNKLLLLILCRGCSRK